MGSERSRPPIFLAAFLLIAIPLLSQTGTVQRASFEVVSIKRNTSESHNSMWGCHGTDTKAVNSPFPLGRCVATHAPIQFIIAEAYGVPSEQILSAVTGGPGWLLSDFYDI